MRTLYTLLVASILLASLLAMLSPSVLATDTSIGIDIDFETEDFAPLIWMCDHRKVIDDPVEPGRINGDSVYSEKIETCEFEFEACVTECESDVESICYQVDEGPAECLYFDHDPNACLTLCGSVVFKVTGDVEGEDVEDFFRDLGLGWIIDKHDVPDLSCDIFKGYELVERLENYAFEGEKLEWVVLVMDKNKIEDVIEVAATIGSMQGEGNDIEVECVRLNGYFPPGGTLPPECNARIQEEKLTQFDDQTQAFYECTLTVETPFSMDGEYWVTVEACDASDNCATMDENEFWFFNPLIAVDILGDVSFGEVRPGTISYSDTILVLNDADAGSGVMLDMFISGTDFYDPNPSGARCVITNRLKLGDNFVASGADSNWNECRIGFGDTDDHLCYFASNGAYDTQPFNDPRADAEGYVPIVYGDTFSPDFYNDAEIIWDGLSPALGPYSPGNVLSPGAEIALTLKLGLPEPCVGDFTDGSIYFWGEAI
jgi:hypothetical protein